jgi:short-subunit dehydrogenase
MKKILIVGAASAIAAACARLWAAEQAEFFLVGRDIEKLQQTADDLKARGATMTHTHELDLNRFDAHAAMLDACFGCLKQVNIALIAHGTLPDQKACEQDVAITLQEFSNNGLSVIALLTLLANRMEVQRSGTIAVISSVAGDRGRPSNYLYGTAKAAVSTFCEGLRARLFKVGVHVITIKPGFVNTPMTKGLPLPSLLVASSEQVAKAIVIAIERRKDTAYVPRFWLGIMALIKLLPGPMFKRMRPRSRGMACFVQRRMSHIFVAVE